ncbi:hypothetical protein H9Q69_011380 [Fusarium xylarioides]|nr:hypothetical protein H9Q70_012815 [Fusarium xylarioides]KAG5782775.1 hypothetical protein H9Q73_003575 [Fusarium xylarioides]KAG5789571.1 hypothetical protein H9Q69_011380 [Fusarium xylarioides]
MGYWLGDEVFVTLESIGKVQQTLDHLQNRYPNLGNPGPQPGGPLYPTQEVVVQLLFDLQVATMQVRDLSKFQPFDACDERVVLSLTTMTRTLKEKVYKLQGDIWNTDPVRRLQDVDGNFHLNPSSLGRW